MHVTAKAMNTVRSVIGQLTGKREWITPPLSTVHGSEIN